MNRELNPSARALKYESLLEPTEVVVLGFLEALRVAKRAILHSTLEVMDQPTQDRHCPGFRAQMQEAEQ